MTKSNNGITIKGVAFNINDPDQLLMFNHANKRSNFSAYVKRLIQRDMEGGYSSGSAHLQKAEPTEEPFTPNEGLMGDLF